MKSISGITVLGLLLAAPVAAGIASDIAFCQFEVPRYVKEGNFNFYVIFTFSLDEEGRPSAITKLKNDYVRDEEVKSCLRDWRLEGFSEAAMISVSFHWTHAVGWDRLAISGPGFEQRILLTGERVPYRPVEDSAKRPIGAGHDEVTKLASGVGTPGQAIVGTHCSGRVSTADRRRSRMPAPEPLAERRHNVYN